MKYKLFFDVILCDRFCSNFIRVCNLGISDYGVAGIVSFTTETEPTDEYIEKIIEQLEKTKEEKSLKFYYANVKLNRIEVIK